MEVVRNIWVCLEICIALVRFPSVGCCVCTQCTLAELDGDSHLAWFDFILFMDRSEA
jgi:hypothetical protein